MDLQNATIRHTVKSVEFGFYSDEDNRRRSVCEIRSPLSFDALGNVLPYGLYTPHLGPLHTRDGSCVTCGQLFNDCPGHFGHIELSLPIYHPLLFGTMYKMLKLKCLHCHQFRCKASVVYKGLVKLMLVKAGQVERALELEEEIQVKLRQSRGGAIKMDNADKGSAESKMKSGRASGKSSIGNSIADVNYAERTTMKILNDVMKEIEHIDFKQVQLTAHARTIYKNLRKAILSDLGGPANSKCQNCGYVSNKFRKDGQGGGKVFKCPLSLKSKESNRELKFKAISALNLESKLAEKGINVEEYSRRISSGTTLWRILHNGGR